MRCGQIVLGPAGSGKASHDRTNDPPHSYRCDIFSHPIVITCSSIVKTVVGECSLSTWILLPKISNMSSILVWWSFYNGVCDICVGRH